MSEKFYPSRGKVAIQKLEIKEETNSYGIIYQEKDNQQYVKGKVLSIGMPGTYKSGVERKIDCSEGDIVYYDRLQAMGVNAYDIVPYDAILGVVIDETD